MLRNDSANSTDRTLHAKDCTAPETPHHVLPGQVFGSFGLYSIGRVPGILHHVLPKQMFGIFGLYSIENVFGTLCSRYECLLGAYGIEFLNNGF